jgi:hypothetical protein
MSLWLSVSRTRATWVDLGFLRGLLIFVGEVGKHRLALDQHPERRSDRVIGYGRLELEAAMRPSAAVVGLILDQCVLQMAFAGDQAGCGPAGQSMFRRGRR